MKKAYIQPKVDVYILNSEMMMAGSGVKGDIGIGWGGVDEEGTKDPDANEVSIWDSEDDDITDSSSFLWGNVDFSGW